MKEKSREDLFAELSQLIANISDNLPKEELGTWYEVVSRELGVLDGIHCLTGVPQPERYRSQNYYFISGKSSVLKAHKALCPDKENCTAALNLDDEILSERTLHTALYGEPVILPTNPASSSEKSDPKEGYNILPIIKKPDPKDLN